MSHSGGKTNFSPTVHEADPDSVWEGPLDVHGAVGVSQWHSQVPRLLQLYQEEEHDRAQTEAGYTQGEPQACSEHLNAYMYMHLCV